MATIAILYPGDMGSAIALCLNKKGHKVVSCLDGRSIRTINNAKKCHVENLKSFDEMISFSDIVISLVPPNAVMTNAEQYIQAAVKAGKKTPFVDMNAKSVKTAKIIEAKMRAAKIPFTNACIIGEAARIMETGHVYSSGSKSELLSKILEGSIKETYLGKEVEKATQIKMCFAGLNKIIAATFFEIALIANDYGILDNLFNEARVKMPGLMSDIGRLIPSYPRHIKRRAEEMDELSKMFDVSKISSYMAKAAAKTFENIISNEYFKNQENYSTDDMMDILKLLHSKN